MIDREEFDASRCSVARALEVMGDKWSLLLLREAFYGVRRFDDFQEHLGIARNLLGARLRKLVQDGLFERRPYQLTGSRPREEYRLTQMGKDLFPAIIALMQWGDRWLAGRRGPPVTVEHNGCGEPVQAVLMCSRGHARLTARDTRPRSRKSRKAG
jgi:DNA-binding HxlR family transcriptional regulator